MNLNQIYKKVVEKGIDADIRSRSAIKESLSAKKKELDNLSKKEKDYFDQDALFNPFADTRIIYGNPEDKITGAIVGIDIGAGELLLADRLNQKGAKINLAISHHPQGLAFAQFYDVMDLQIDGFKDYGISLSLAENTLFARKGEVARKVHAANFNKARDVAKLLNLNFFCMHTPCDNLAYQFLRKRIDQEKPSKLEGIMDILYSIDEYQDAAKHNNPPKIIIGNKKSRCQKIHLEFTGGTEGPKSIYKELSASGVDTIVAMHQSEAHYKKCKEANINVIFASHIASDNIGVNLMLDHLQASKNFKVYEVSGFTRIKRKK
ncbi:MAG: NGG1p interacting factor NIF3 [Candidatus Omnitrophica bacterium]|nr:NGG1p interacting factor NIF3 [Candidatus Omnitrophota bacterium]